ncbi:hypothetical protein QBC38DRAFT_250697 [Podospora fimiseda]|uniref:R3H domain-containing protein n=1 Tax=Podospora fimiseda TaxID=252190 RepID=A0AAN7GVU5_9PEZI|nr:hypothetical protein QBC38DRAFT_250697 [Podospora fimiseda]
MAAVPTMVNDSKRMSFARVAAASASKDPSSVTAVARTPAPAPSKDRRDNVKPVTVAIPIPVVPVIPKAPVSAPEKNPPSPDGQKKNATQNAETKVVEGLKDLKLETATPVNGSLSGTTERSNRLGNSQTPSDDTSQRADSNSELGTKPPSLDGKSITSGTTFALDEKESLRPDDSASVKAAAEDDDTFSIRGSYMASSRMGSDVASRMHRLQIGDMPPRVISTQVLAGSKNQGTTTPQSGVSEKQLATDAKLPLANGAMAQDAMANGFLSQHPDEKLLEAMQSPKDRIFLLRLEQQVIEFVQDSKEPFMDLPPSNSFCRMLMHKLADYYHMTHSFEAGAGAVRIFRTPFCRIPASLSSIASSTPSSSSPAPAVIPRKIMRRGEDGEFGPGSAGPSKPTSEAGSDSKDKTAPTKEKLTREEREEAYNKARQRIFGSVEKTENQTQDGEENTGVSRASSVSAKDRTNGGKRKVNKQRRDDNEGFEPRSQFVAWCGPQQQTWAQAAPQYYPVSATQFNGQFPQPYPNGMPPIYAPPPGHQYAPQMVVNNGYPAQYNGIPQPYSAPPVPQARPPPPPQPAQVYQTPTAPPMAGPGPYGTPVASVAQPVWSQQQPQPPLQAQPPHIAHHQPQPQQLPPPQQQQPVAATATYPQNAYPPPRGSPAPPAPGIPYAYGQLPVNVNPNDPKSQHPIPGSYNRQVFNPKTQSFVPGSGIPMQAPPPNPYGGTSSHQSSPHPQFNSPHMSYSGYQQPVPPMPQPGYVPGPYSMARQGSNTSMTQYHGPPPPHGSQHMVPVQAGPPPSMHMGGMPPKPNGGVPPGSGQVFSHLPTYGNPASLPQKPST